MFVVVDENKEKDDEAAEENAAN